MCCWSPKETRAPSFCRNSSLKDFPVAISIVRRRKFLGFLSSRRNAFEIEILAKSAGGKSLLHCGKCLQLDSALKEDMSWHIYVSAFRLLLLDINHEIIFYSNQTDRVKLISQLNLQEQKIQQARRYLGGSSQADLVQNYFPLLVSLVELYTFDQVVISRDYRWVWLKFDCVEHSVNGELLLIIVGSMMCILNILNINLRLFLLYQDNHHHAKWASEWLCECSIFDAAVKKVNLKNVPTQEIYWQQAIIPKTYIQVI